MEGWRIPFVFSLCVLAAFAKPGQHPYGAPPNPLFQQLTSQSQITSLGANSYYVIRPQHLVPGSFSAQHPQVLSALQASLPQPPPGTAPASPAPAAPQPPTHYQVSLPQNGQQVPLNYRAVPLGPLPVHSSFVPLTQPLNVVKYVLASPQATAATPTTTTQRPRNAPSRGRGNSNNNRDRDDDDDLDDEDLDEYDDEERDDYEELSPSDFDEQRAPLNNEDSDAFTNNVDEFVAAEQMRNTQSESPPPRTQSGGRNRGNGNSNGRNRGNNNRNRPSNRRRNQNRRPTPNSLFDENSGNLADIRNVNGEDAGSNNNGRPRNSGSRENTRNRNNRPRNRKNGNNNRNRNNNRSRPNNSTTTTTTPTTTTTTRRPVYFTTNSPRQQQQQQQRPQQQQQNNGYSSNANANSGYGSNTISNSYGSNTNSNAPLQILPPRDLQQGSSRNYGNPSSGITIQQSSQPAPNSQYGPPQSNGVISGVNQDIEYRVIPAVRYEVANNGHTVVPSSDEGSGGYGNNPNQIQNQPAPQYGPPPSQNQNQNRPSQPASSGGYQLAPIQQLPTNYGPPNNQLNLPSSPVGGYQVNQLNVQQIKPNSPALQYGSPQSSGSNPGKSGDYSISPGNEHQLIQPALELTQYGSPAPPSTTYGAPYSPGKPLTTSYGPPGISGTGTNSGGGYTLQPISLGNSDDGSNLNDVLSLVRQFATSQITGKNSVTLGNGRQSQFSISPSNTYAPQNSPQVYRAIPSNPAPAQSYGVKAIASSGSYNHPGYGVPTQTAAASSGSPDFRTSITVAYGAPGQASLGSVASHGSHPPALFQTIENVLRKTNY